MPAFTLSRRRAIVSFHGIRISGFPAWVMWLLVHTAFLTGSKNRFRALVSWTFSFLGSGRTERALTSIPERTTTREHEHV